MSMTLQMGGHEDRSEIAEFYAGKTVFITGGTGFIGKVLVEKLLRSCNGISHIYLLVRNKGGIEPGDRFKHIFDSKLFDRAKEEQPGCFEKVSYVVGSLEYDNLGMSSNDYNTVCTETSIIIHAAAILRLNDKLKTVLIRNLLGTRHVIDLAKKCENLQALVYVSTAYCNTHQENINEVIYPTEFSASNIASCLSWMKEEMMESARPLLLSRHPNNYTYSKCLSEQLLSEEGKQLPIVIIRPTLVLSAYKEPYQGWFDCYNGISALMIAISQGLLRTVFCPCQQIDIIPVDYCVNLIVASAWNISSRGEGSLVVYNCSANTINPALKEAGAINRFWKEATHFPSSRFYRRPKVSVRKSKFLHEIHNFFSHLIPALIFDLILLITRRNPKMILAYKKHRNLLNDFEYFLSYDWYFHSENFKVLLTLMSEEDKKTFDIDVRNINWKNYFILFQSNIRHNILKEDPSTLKKARKLVNRWYYLSLGMYGVMFGLLSYALREKIVAYSFSSYF